MSASARPNAYGVVTAPATVTIQRLLPGPVERVWAYLTESDLRKQWLAAGEMTLMHGAPVELVWRNDELSDPPGQRPEGAPAEKRMQSEITAVEPLRKLAITWGSTSGVSFELAPQADGQVLLTVIHKRLPDRSTMLNVSAGWHAHLDALATRLDGGKVSSFWDTWSGLKAEYEQRIPAGEPV